MKNFKEWKNNFKSYRVFVTEDGYEGWVTKPTDKDAWKAALEWALESEGYNPNRSWEDKIIEELRND